MSPRCWTLRKKTTIGESSSKSQTLVLPLSHPPLQLPAPAPAATEVVVIPSHGMREFCPAARRQFVGRAPCPLLTPAGFVFGGNISSGPLGTAILRPW